MIVYKVKKGISVARRNTDLISRVRYFLKGELNKKSKLFWEKNNLFNLVWDSIILELLH